MRAFALVTIVLTACASSQTEETQTVAPEDIAGMWTVELPDRTQYTMHIPNDTSRDAETRLYHEEASRGGPMCRGVLRALVRSRYVICPLNQNYPSGGGYELRYQSGQLAIMRYHDCPPRGTGNFSVRRCVQTPLVIRRVQG